MSVNKDNYESDFEKLKSMGFSNFQIAISNIYENLDERINHIFTSNNETKENVFIIYTTGLGYGDSYSGYLSALTWLNKLLVPFIQRIPDNFTKIYIFHYDLLFGIKGETKNQIIQDLKNYFNNSSNIDNREVISVFTPESIYNLPLENINYPHLILDFAHIFDYINPGIVSVAGRYSKEHEPVGKSYSLNSIYVGFIGGNSQKVIQYLLKDNLLTIDRSGKITTYIDKILENQNLIPLFDKIYPIDIIEQKIYLSIRKQIMTNWKDKYGNIDSKFDEFMQKYDDNIKNDIFNMIVTTITVSEIELNIMSKLPLI